MKILLVFILGFFILFLSFSAYAGQIITEDDLICSKKNLIEMLWKADKDICTSGYALFIKTEDIDGNKVVEGICLSKEDLKEAIEGRRELQELYMESLRDYGSKKDPCRGYKEKWEVFSVYVY